ncbi:MAG: hypothetical protein A3E79_05185 [Burkholderiales bacterium RIFCSPHIGHO2_12_FULL_61_11]|nr:MAG: hypothetical protein A3E79_05185 [Burkholderiales bacterium RIFCSPHIGHO2_12_FULL_61_11]
MTISLAGKAIDLTVQAHHTPEKSHGPIEPLRRLSLKEANLIQGGQHILVAYKMKPKPGHAYLEAAAHFAAGSSTSSKVEVSTLMPASLLWLAAARVRQAAGLVHGGGKSPMHFSQCRRIFNFLLTSPAARNARSRGDTIEQLEIRKQTFHKMFF